MYTRLTAFYAGWAGTGRGQGSKPEIPGIPSSGRPQSPLLLLTAVCQPSKETVPAIQQTTELQGLDCGSGGSGQSAASTTWRLCGKHSPLVNVPAYIL